MCKISFWVRLLLIYILTKKLCANDHCMCNVDMLMTSLWDHKLHSSKNHKHYLEKLMTELHEPQQNLAVIFEMSLLFFVVLYLSISEKLSNMNLFQFCHILFCDILTECGVAWRGMLTLSTHLVLLRLEFMFFIRVFFF